MLFNRSLRLVVSRYTELIRSLEKPIPVLENAKRKLFDQGVDTFKKAENLRAHAVKITDQDVQRRILDSADKLEERAKQIKLKYLDFDSKIAELRSRQDIAKAEISFAKTMSNTSSTHDLGSIIADAERKIEEYESEAKAYLKMTEV